MKELNDFGKATKKKLIDLNKNQKWLIEKVREKRGCYIDNSYLNRLMKGMAASSPMVQAINEILSDEEVKENAVSRMP